MVRNFLSEAPLAASAREALLDAFDQGWNDPHKLSQGASTARNLRHNAVEAIAARLNIHPSELECVGEPAFGHFLALQGLVYPASRIFYSSVDRKEIHALARGSKGVELPVEPDGHIIPEAIGVMKASDALALQVANGETGIIQDIEGLTQQVRSLSGDARISLDFTNAGLYRPLPSHWDSALFDSRTWNGPQGLGVLAIRNGSPWRNPLPHVNSSRVPESFSLPLLIASAVALETWHSAEVQMRKLSRKLRDAIAWRVPDCDIAGDLSHSLPHINSFSFLYVEGEELLRRLENRGFLVDSGSACTSEDLLPSHVLAAMGLLTHGNIRVTIHPHINEQDIDDLIVALCECVEELRT